MVIPDEMRESPILGWCVWYGSGKVKRSDTWTAEAIPDEDVQAVVVYFWHENDCRRMVFCGVDEYQLPGSSRVLRGKYMATHDDYAKLKVKVHADKWRPKHGNISSDRVPPGNWAEL